MKKEPERKTNRICRIVCLIVVVAITAARIVCELAGAAWPDTLTRALGVVEMIAVAVLVYSLIKQRQKK